MMKPRISKTSLIVVGAAIAGAAIPPPVNAAVAEGGTHPAVDPTLNRLDARSEELLTTREYRLAIASPAPILSPSFSSSNLDAISPDEEIWIAQAIAPANGGTGTQVTQDGNQFNIEGGSRAGDNLFHSFERLGLDAGQIANFISNPDIQNILGRVVGGDASVINGLIQVTGGDSNLYLMNPAGIIFGPDSQLNVPAAFTATTANAIQIDDYWFKAMGSNDYANLVGTPSGFAFTTDQPGTLLNAGDLSVSPGESVTLLGGLVINTGTISAPGGDITIASVPGESLVSISQEGSLLSLALPADTQAEINGDTPPMTPLSLPELLTGGDLPAATGVVLVDGLVRLTSPDTVIPTEAGTTIVSQDSIINADAANEGNGGQVIVSADSTTQFYGNISAGGGNVFGDGGFIEISAKENLTFLSEVDLDAPNGDEGTLLLGLNTLAIIDPEVIPEDRANTILVDQLEAFGGDAIIILEADDGITIEDIKDDSLDLPLFFEGSITLRADADNNGVGNFTVEDLRDTISIGEGTLKISGFDIEAGSIISDDGNITLTAGQDIILKGSNLTDFNIRNGNLGANRDITITGNAIDVDDLRAVRNITIRGMDGTPSSSIDTDDLIAGQDIQLIGNRIETESSSAGRDFLIQGDNIDLTGDENARLRAGNNFIIDAKNTLTVSDRDSPIGLIAGNDLILMSGGALTLQSSNESNDFDNFEDDDGFGPIQLQSTRDIYLEAGGSLEIIDSFDGFFWAQADGEINIEGQSVEIDAQNNPNSWFRSQGDINLISDSGNDITAEARFATGSVFSIDDVSFNQDSETLPDNIVRVSLNEIISSTGDVSFNGIISSTGDVSFNGYEGVALKIETTGSITANGDITITDSNDSFLPDVEEDQLLLAFDPDVALLASGPALILRAGVGVDELSNPPNILIGSEFQVESPDGATTTFTIAQESTSPGNISVIDGDTGRNINTEGEGDTTGPVLLSANGDIRTGSITTEEAPDFLGNSVTLLSTGNITVDFIKAGEGESPPEFGGDIEVEALGFFRAIGSFNDFDVEEDGLPDLNEGDLSFDDIRGSLVLGNRAPIPTSISATGDSASGIVEIRYGTETLAVGPKFIRDENGEIIFEVRETVGDLQAGTRVFLAFNEAGDAEFRRVDDNSIVSDLSFRNVTFMSEILNSETNNGSFIAGAITSSQNNNNNVSSIRDDPLIS